MPNTTANELTIAEVRRRLTVGSLFTATFLGRPLVDEEGYPL